MTPAPPRPLPPEAQLLSLIAANIRDMVVFVDLDGRIRWVNQAVEAQFGYSRKELIGAHVYMLQAPGKNPPGFWTAGGGGEPLEKWAGMIVDRRKDGSEFAARVESFLVKDAGGAVAGIASISRDISDRISAERALRESESRYRDFFATSRDSVFITSAEGAWIDFNDAALEMFGYESREEMAEVPVASLYADPEERSRIFSLIEQRGSVREHPVRLIRKDGTVIDALITAAFRRGAPGPGGEYFGTIRDITKRKKAEEALQASQRILEEIINAIPVRVFWKDRNLRYLGCNAIFARDAGCSDPGDIIGRDDCHLSWRDQAERYRSDDRQVIESGKAKILIEEPQTTPDGGMITLLTSKVPLRGPRGEIIGVLGTYMDITERKKADEELRASRAFLRGVIDLIPSLVFAKDTEGRYLLVNKALADAYGTVPDRMVGRTDAELAARPEEAADFLRADREVLETGREKIIQEEKFTWPSGEERYYQTTKRPLTDERGACTGVLAVSVDITERKASQRTLEERNRELEIISGAALTREFRIKELRDEIKALKAKTAKAGGEA